MPSFRLRSAHLAGDPRWSAPLVLALLLSIPAPSPSASTGADPLPSFAGAWTGSIELPAGELAIGVMFQERSAGLVGTIDIPAQGARGLELERISTDGSTIEFRIAGVPGKPTFDGTLEGERITGAFQQSGATLRFELERGTKLEVDRPQTPQEPFPYSSEEVSFQSGRARLAGTLTVPEGGGEHPAVLLLSGSGPQDRDGTVFRHQPFLVWADLLSRRGFAVLRVDDRGVGGSSGVLQEATTEVLAADAQAAVRYLQSHPSVDPNRVGLLGHSEGGIVAPFAAERARGAVEFVVLLAAPAVPGDEILKVQTEKILEANGISEEASSRQRALLAEALELIRAEAPERQRRKALRDLATEQIANLPENQRKALGSRIGGVVDQQIAAAMTPWFEAFVRHDPRPALRALTAPTLALYGSLDLQVAPEQNRPAMETALREHPDAEVIELEGLNHLLQRATTGSPLEYEVLEETVAPIVLETVFRWLESRFLEPRGAAHSVSGES